MKKKYSQTIPFILRLVATFHQSENWTKLARVPMNELSSFILSGETKQHYKNKYNSISSRCNECVLKSQTQTGASVPLGFCYHLAVAEVFLLQKYIHNKIRNNFIHQHSTYSSALLGHHVIRYAIPLSFLLSSLKSNYI